MWPLQSSFPRNLFLAYLRAISPRANEKLLLHIKQIMAGDDTLRTRFEALLSEVDQYDSRD